MNVRTDLDRCAGEGSAWTAAVHEPDHPPVGARLLDGSEGIRSTALADEGPDHANRMSVDPFRGTDRYRLVAPLPLRF